MRSVHEVLRSRSSLDRIQREIAAVVGISLSTVSSYLSRAAAGLSWPLPEEMDDDALTAALFPPRAPSSTSARPEPDWADIHRQLTGKRDLRGKCVKGMTLRALWVEYLESNPGGFQYSRFCDLQKQCRGRVDVVMW